MIVTIDGPAGTGKSTVARQLAVRIGFAFLDTGAMYRGIAATCLNADIDPDDAAAVAALTAEAQIEFQDDRTVINGIDVTDQLRTSATSQAASRVAQITAVREALVALQRRWAESRNVVSEGRDQGTVAFPTAEFKFFLDADPKERARRRQQELASRGENIPLDILLAEQTARDERDRNRSVAPLRPAKDAMMVDTTDLSVVAVIDQLEDIVRSRLPQE